MSKPSTIDEYKLIWHFSKLQTGSLFWALLWLHNDLYFYKQHDTEIKYTVFPPRSNHCSFLSMKKCGHLCWRSAVLTDNIFWFQFLKFENFICCSMTLVEVVGKCFRRVPVLLTRTMIAAVDALILQRERGEVQDPNPYVFAQVCETLFYFDFWNYAPQ